MVMVADINGILLYWGRLPQSWPGGLAHNSTVLLTINAYPRAVPKPVLLREPNESAAQEGYPAHIVSSFIDSQIAISVRISLYVRIATMKRA